ncbi:hypothetical protein V9T40_007815 [Parthenolecanium corni]|uniref:MICOS complex subunit MIC19 n=1 Tax=Parthenolecanium corni TaxID=536013 RepID=A0AAN9Y674_9HEMI
MGSSQSAPRKVTLENPNETIIEITDGVINRLDGANNSEKIQPESVSSTQPPSINENAAAFVTSQEIRRQVDKVVQENDNFWQSRIKILRDGYQKIGVELEAEYQKATKDVNHSLGTHFGDGNASNDSCRSSQASVVDCFSQNSNRPLLCANEVQKFNECVSSLSCVKAK